MLMQAKIGAIDPEVKAKIDTLKDQRSRVESAIDRGEFTAESDGWEIWRELTRGINRLVIEGA